MADYARSLPLFVEWNKAWKNWTKIKDVYNLSNETKIHAPQFNGKQFHMCLCLTWLLNSCGCSIQTVPESCLNTVPVDNESF